MKTTIFLDMDGVLAVYNPNTPKLMYNEGFFAALPANETMIETAKALLADDSLDVYILTTVLSDSPTAVTEKSGWLDRHLPEVSKDKRIYVPIGYPKVKFIEDEFDFKGKLVLIDDFTSNLVAWVDEGNIGIKVVNGINGSKGVWKQIGGPEISYFNHPTENYKKVIKVIDEAKKAG